MSTPTTRNMSLEDGNNSPQPDKAPLFYGPISPMSPMGHTTFADQQLPIGESEESSLTTIEPGTYVAFALARQSLAAQFPEGSEAHQTIFKFPIGRYIGLVTSSCMYRTNDGTVQEMVIHFATKAPSPSLSVADHCLPISSISAKSDSARPPLQTTTFFPWIDCMQFTTLGVRVVVEDIHESPLKFTLEHEEFDRFEETAMEDCREFDAIEETLSLDERAKVRRLEVQHYTLPVELWMDIRLGDVKANPLAFADGVDALEWCVLSEA